MSNDLFLDLLDKPLDSNQKRCCTVKENAVIKAGAGSGKTQVFSNRFSWLIMRDEKPLEINEILTLTFTNKAAAEMYQRIYETLKNYAHTDITDNNKREKITDDQINRANNALQTFSTAHIQTLDSYCGDLVRKHASKLGLPQNFSIASKENDSYLEQQALSFVIYNKEDSGIKHFIKPGKFEEFSSDLADMIKNHTSIVTENKYFTACLEKQKNQIEKDEQNLNFDDLRNYMAENPRDSNFFNNLKTELNKNYPSGWELIAAASEISTRGSSDRELKELFFSYITNKAKQAKAALDFNKEYSFLLSLCQLMDRFIEIVNTNKRIKGALSFKDVQDAALHLLKTEKDIQLEESKRFKQIMIDEFQDNNRDNRDMLLLLCGVPTELIDNIDTEEGKQAVCEFLKKNEPEKLYFVGDEKQSIYRFREADVKVFNTLEEIIGQEKGSLFMSYNYRSDAELLSSFNLLFGGMKEPNNSEKSASILKQEDSSGYDAGFPSTAYIMKREKINTNQMADVQLPVITNENCKVELCLLNENISDKKDDFMVQFIADKIKDLKDSGYNYSDIAILDKSRTKRSLFCRYFAKNGIPYVLDEEKELFSDGPVNDIFAVLKLMCGAKNTLTWGTFLCSPFVGMTVNEAYNCLNSEKQKKEINNKRYKAAKDLLNKIKEKKYDSLTNILNYLWYDLGYIYNVKENIVTESYAKQFDILFELARQAEERGKNLLWYTNQLEKRKTKEESFLSSKKDDDSELDVENVKCPIEQPDAVQIMTIHKSKGLQFKIVFVLGCLRYSRRPSNTNFYCDRTTGVSIKTSSNLNYFFEKNIESIKKEERAEFKRLIYVALTRAENQVFIVGKKSELKPGEKAEKENYPWKDINNSEDNVYYIETEISSLGSPSGIKEKQTSWIEKPSFPAKPKLRTSPSALEVLHKENPNTPEHIPYEEVNNIIKDTSFEFSDFGTLAHKVMENLVNGIDSRTYDWNEMNFVIEPKKRTRLIEIAIKMSDAFKNTELYKEITKSAFKKTEWSFKTFHKKAFISGSIDLFFQDSTGHYIIVDYKTDQYSDNMEKYYEQQQLYREVAANLLKTITGKNVNENDISCYLFYLRFGQLVDITENCKKTTISNKMLSEVDRLNEFDS